MVVTRIVVLSCAAQIPGVLLPGVHYSREELLVESKYVQRWALDVVFEQLRVLGVTSLSIAVYADVIEAGAFEPVDHADEEANENGSSRRRGHMLPWVCRGVRAIELLLWPLLTLTKLAHLKLNVSDTCLCQLWHTSCDAFGNPIPPC